MMLSIAVAAMQDRFSFAVPTSQLPLAFQQAELALSRAVKLSEQCRSLFERQPLLTGVGVADTASAAAAAAAGQQAWLRLTLIAVEQQLKVDVQLGLGGLLAGNSAAGEHAAGQQLSCMDDGLDRKHSCECCWKAGGWRASPAQLPAQQSSLLCCPSDVSRWQQKAERKSSWSLRVVLM